eukprot:gnl/MRDRNA2_/MRDRNA2_38734_c0_seq1.p1 gnl/MRDRNA2_/MRDRNA2_38734_c0~~gnl/MRDRNA2_/MRDRNA2_38734_c0_seq1.p1  ORF type:complete len:117 (-),score=10.56 gnl/MRDRNA2_/MRDRNA2_38734_c0_seq1:101-427(-)
MTDPSYEGPVPEFWRLAASLVFVCCVLFILLILLFPSLITFEAEAIVSDFKYRPNDTWLGLKQYLDATKVGFKIMGFPLRPQLMLVFMYSAASFACLRGGDLMELMSA